MRRNLKTALRLTVALPAAAFFFNISGSPAQAAGIIFNFAGLPNQDSGGGDFKPPSSYDNSASIATYMEGATLLDTASTGWNVSVTGAESQGTSSYGYTTAKTGYAGEGYVVCVANSTCGTTSNHNGNYVNNLSTYSNGLDAANGGGVFLMTSGKSQVGGKDAITMTFGGGVTVNSLSFAFEIFPDDGCPNGASRGCSIPDFNFVMTGTVGGHANTTVANITVDAHEPNTVSGTTGTVTSGAGDTDNDGTFSYTCTDLTTYSQNNHPETADQCMGTMDLNFTAGVVTNPTLEFIDWPATIGITDIDWGLPGDPVPEPASLFLFSSGLLGMAAARRRKARGM